MPSKQMAFQLTAFEYREALKLFVALRQRGVDIQGYLALVPDQGKRARLSGALQVAVKCHAAGIDPLRVRKIVCWRDERGNPGALDTQLAEVS